MGADSCPLTAVEDAIMRLGMVLKEINPGNNPYPESYNPESAKIEPYDYQHHIVSRDVWERLQTKAREQLNGDLLHASSAVIERWKSVAAGNVPCDFRVED